ncbi:MAG TPA: hypothetical protein VN428_00305 [Bryobacteraceae bacterium]|nr:hypothetical protein [Bryobacteraceae bacterium]
MRTLMPGVSNPAEEKGGSGRVLLITPARATSFELRALMERELPSLELTLFERYPDREEVLELAAEPGTRVCLLDVAAQPAAADLVIETLSHRDPRVPVVAVLPANDPDLMLRSLRQGASEFLVRPFTADQLQAVFAKLSGADRKKPEAAGGRVIGVIPAKGSVGATTLACNLAPALARRVKGRVLLADLDGLAGTVAFVMKIRSTYSFADALQQSGCLDPDLWKALVTPSQGIDVLLSPENPIDGLDPSCDPGPILDYARAHYDLVIADCGGTFGHWNTEIAKRAAGIVLVTTQEIASVHGAQRALASLEHASMDPGRISLIVNRWRPNVPLTPEKIGASLAMDVLQTLPDAPDAIRKALIDGKAAAVASRYGGAIAELADKLAGQERPVVAKGGAASSLAGWFARLW